MTEIVIEDHQQPDDRMVTLDPAEEELMNEITIQHEPRIKAPKIKRKKSTPKLQMHNEDMEAFINPNKTSAPAPEPQYEDDYQEEDGSVVSSVSEMYTPQPNQPSPGYASIDDEKADLLNKLSRLEKKGFHTNKKLNIYSDIEELRTEFKRIQYNIDLDASLRFSRRMLVACITGVEFLNKRYNPFDLYLDGWSESIMENVDDYDPVFEDLYNKYKTKAKMSPEIKLIMMLGGSATMFHLTNSMFKAAVPNVSEILKQNPGLQNNIMEAVQNARPPMQEHSDDRGRREMQGPPVDIASMLGGISFPPIATPPVSTRGIGQITEKTPVIQEEDDETGSVSDIVSVSGKSNEEDVRDVQIKAKTKRRNKKNEINL